MKYKKIKQENEMQETEVLTESQIKEEEEKTYTDVKDGEECEHEEHKTVFTSELSEKIECMLIDQISNELYNHNLYKTFAIFFQNEGLTDLYKYYNARATEEYNHHQWIVDYLGQKNIDFTYPCVSEVKEDYKDVIDILNLTLKVELKTTERIHDIVNAAIEEKDWATFNWLNSNGKLVKEQIEEEALSQAVLDIATLDDSWIVKAKAIYKEYRKKK